MKKATFILLALVLGFLNALVIAGETRFGAIELFDKPGYLQLTDSYGRTWYLWLDPEGDGHLRLTRATDVTVDARGTVTLPVGVGQSIISNLTE